MSSNAIDQNVSNSSAQERSEKVEVVASISPEQPTSTNPPPQLQSNMSISSCASIPGAPFSGDAVTEGDLMKYLVVTGGTISGLGKGTTISSVGVVLQSIGYRVTAIKIDPYLNVDAGTMSPYEHGEVFVLEDGGEVDLDLGNYERLLDVTLTREHNLTSGKVYESVLSRERRGEYLGKTVQVIPHVTDAIQRWITKVARRPVDKLSGPSDVCLIEVGGTVGDIESSVYLEALQQLCSKVGSDNFCLCHVSYIPHVGGAQFGEQKTKPTQHGVKTLREAGLRPDFIFCRSDEPLSSSARQKIVLFGQVPAEQVISVHNVENIYQVPLLLQSQNFGELVTQKLKLSPKPENLKRVLDLDLKKRWEILAARMASTSQMASKKPTRIGLVGKYTGLQDTYLSVVKALQHAAAEANGQVEIVWIDSSTLEEEFKDSSDQDKRKMWEESWRLLKSVDGVLCPGGFGDRGIMGKAESARYCRESKTPYLGICLGMQTAVIEFCRNVLGMRTANSEEFDAECSEKVVVFMPEGSLDRLGGTMRLGNRATIIRDTNSLAFKLYDKNPVIYERHRHRYEVNPEIVSAMECRGMKFVGQDDKGQRMEIAELEDHPFFLCVQYHPEFTSRPLHPNPCFLGFFLASKGGLKKRLNHYGQKLMSGATFTSWDTDESTSSPILDKVVDGGVSATAVLTTSANKSVTVLAKENECPR